MFGATNLIYNFLFAVNIDKKQKEDKHFSEWTKVIADKIKGANGKKRKKKI